MLWTLLTSREMLAGKLAMDISRRWQGKLAGDTTGYGYSAVELNITIPGINKTLYNYLLSIYLGEMLELLQYLHTTHYTYPDQ
jgi:hypothetical protein